MADIDENLQTFLEAVAGLSAATIGQSIPEEFDLPMVWYMQAAETEDDEIIENVVDFTAFNIEIYSDDIEQCRDMTNATKTALKAINWDAVFEGVVQFARVVDHDDEYERHIDFKDTPVHNGNLYVELHQ